MFGTPALSPLCRYKDNKEVMAFYQNMAATMATRFEQLDEEQKRNQAASGSGKPAQQQQQQQQQVSRSEY